MRIGIVGAGALGCLFGGLLSLAGNEIRLVHKNPSIVRTINEKGIRIRETSGRTVTARVYAKLAPADLTDQDLVVFAVKSYDTRKAAVSHNHHIGAETSVLTLQNGIGNVETLASVFGKSRLLGGTTTEASLLLGPGLVAHTGTGETRIGEIGRTVSNRCHLIAREFERAGIKTAVTNNLLGAIWAKTIINSAINPVSALLGVHNGALAEEPALLQAMLGIVREGVEVSRAERVRLEPPRPERVLVRVLRATSRNRSSMLQDLEQGKSTEIRELNGALVRIGRKHGVATPLNQLLTSMILAAEKRQSPVEGRSSSRRVGVGSHPSSTFDGAVIKRSS